MYGYAVVCTFDCAWLGVKWIVDTYIYKSSDRKIGFRWLFTQSWCVMHCVNGKGIKRCPPTISTFLASNDFSVIYIMHISTRLLRVNAGVCCSMLACIYVVNTQFRLWRIKWSNGFGNFILWLRAYHVLCKNSKAENIKTTRFWL